jgi:hypothetical protein
VVEIGVPREIHRPVASHWQTLSHNALSSTPRYECGSSSQLLKVVIDDDCTGSCKFNDHDGSSAAKMKGNCFIDIDGIYDYHCL